MTPLLLTHAAATWALVGLIWLVQLVQYPLFAQVGMDAFPAYHARHTRQITGVVAPLMLIELASAALLVARGMTNPWLLASLAPLACLWLSTWRVQLPLHERLSHGFDAEVHRRLVTSNWWRTAAWSLRGACVWLALR